MNFFVTLYVCIRLRPNYIFAQGIRSTFIPMVLKPLTKSKLILDLHGLHIEESIMAGFYKRKSLVFVFDRFIQRLAIKNSDKIIVVSRAMKEYILNVYNRDKNVVVIPCCYNSSNFRFDEITRKKVRAELDINKNIVFVYSGSFAAWQKTTTVLEFFKLFLNNHELSTLLILSNDPHNEIISESIRLKIPTEKLIIKSVKHKHVWKYLNAADIAFLFRDNSPVNVVSSPTKFAEYLACGLPVITNNSVGDYSKMVTKHNLGMLVDEANINPCLNTINDLLKIDKLSISNFALKNLSWQNNKNLLKTIFN